MTNRAKQITQHTQSITVCDCRSTDDSASMQELIVVLVSIAKRVAQTKNESEVKTN